MKMMMSQDGGNVEMSKISFVNQDENNTALVVQEDSSEDSDRQNNSDDFAEQFRGYQDHSPEVQKEGSLNELNDFEEIHVNDHNYNDGIPQTPRSQNS